MFKIAFVILSVGLLNSCQTIGSDKYMHATGSAAMGIGFSTVTDKPEQAFAACMVVGVAKEMYDEYSYGGFSKGDLVADAIGCAVGVVIINLIKEE